ncbi:hypothetical protein [Nocardiopsis sp. LOL_012]|uniref:hypothetical protein n=1 Tax=Nocardiopsis sp. LOL_012 TaxID=3345409 RepID=UPI003A890736
MVGFRCGLLPHPHVAEPVHGQVGITPPIGRLLVIDWAPNPAEGDKQLFVFDGGVLGRERLEQINLDPAELRGRAPPPAPGPPWSAPGR